MTETPRESVLTEAAGLITGDRNKTYGSPTENFANTAALWNVQIGHKLKTPLTAADVAQLMVQLKMARMIAQPKRDNYVDAAGYIACGWECEEAVADSVETSGPRYFLVPSSPAFYRLQPGERRFTYQRSMEDFRKSSVGTYNESWDEHEIPVDEVPEWAR